MGKVHEADVMGLEFEKLPSESFPGLLAIVMLGLETKMDYLKHSGLGLASKPSAMN